MNPFKDYSKDKYKNNKPIRYKQLIDWIDHISEVLFPPIKGIINKYINNMKEKYVK